MNERAANPMQAAAFLRERSATESHHTQVSISFGERMDSAALRSAWETVCATHPVLRSRFSRSAIGDVALQDSPAAKTTWRELAWQTLSPEEIPDKWAELQKSDAADPFDPDSQVRITEILLPGGSSHYLLSVPPYLLDESSMARVLLDWLVALERAPATPAETPAPLATTAAWTDILKLAEAPLVLHPRPPAPAEISSSLTIGREESRAFLNSCKSKSLDPRAVLHSLWALLLRRLGAAGNVTLGHFDARRSPGEAGFFENWLPVVHAWGSKDWLRDAQQSYDAISDNAWIAPASALTASPAPLTLDHLVAGFAWRGPEVSDLIQTALPRWINFDAKIQTAQPDFLLLEVRGGAQLTLQLHGPLGSEPLGRQLLARLAALMDSLDSVDGKPVAQIPLLLPQESRTLKEWSRGPDGLERPPNTLAAFRHAAAEFPENVAVRDGDYELSYSELDSLSDRLAAHLAHASLAGGWHVALFLSPSSWIAIALIGSWKAGNSCLALDPAAPPEWIESMLTSHDAGVVICDAASAPLLDASTRRRIVLDQEWDNLETGELPSPEINPDSPAAILPGHADGPPPQIRALTHDLLVTAAIEGARVLDFGPADTFLAHSAAGGGAFFDEWLLPILAGGTVRVADDDVLDPVSCQVTHLRLTAPELNNQAARWSRGEAQATTPPRVVAVECGCASKAALEIWNRCTGDSVQIISFFSPAGLCGLGVADIATAEGPLLMIGKPTPDVEASVCDPDGQDVPPGFSGALWMKYPGWKKSSHPRGRRGIDTGLRAWRNGKGSLQLEGPANRFPDFSPAAVRLMAQPDVIDCLIGDQAWTLSPGSVAGTISVPEWPLTRGGWIDESSLPRPEAPAAPKATPKAFPREQPRPAVPWTPVSILQKEGTAAPLVLVPTASGVTETYRDLVSALGTGRRILGLTARGACDPEACHTTVESAAAAWIEAIVEEDPSLPFDLCGFGYGGIAALEMARQFAAAKRRVPGLILIGTPPPQMEKPSGWLSSMKSVFKRLNPDDRMEPFTSIGEPARTHEAAWRRYRFVPCDLQARIIIPSDFPPDSAATWLAILPSARIEPVKCTWAEMLAYPAVKRLASILADS
ncbi:MAG: AMP-binding protein [Verrucomicrobia bacterium]|nr:AMP-binding protein [Verrucomicrobiota bacterium]